MMRPEDRANLFKVFHINACLWGGLFNPIIPFFKRVPLRTEDQLIPDEIEKISV